MNKETLRMQMLAGLITESQYKSKLDGGTKLDEIKIRKPSELKLNNDDLIYDRMLDMDQEQLVSDILGYAENNPLTTLIDYLNNEWGYEDEDEDEDEEDEDEY